MEWNMDLAIPETLRSFAGRMIDVDSHDAVPAQKWEVEYGPAAKILAERFYGQEPNNPGGSNFPAFERDDMPVNAETVWKVKGSFAPGAVDISRRTDVMDLTGVSRQLMFPSGVTIMGCILRSSGDKDGALQGFERRNAYGQELIEAGNRWSIRAARLSDRVRPVAALYGQTVDELMTNAQHLLDSGIRAVWLMGGVPPGGKSPAHTDLDPFWRLLSERQVSVTLHIGGDSGFLGTYEWGSASAFEGFKVSTEFSLSPWNLSIQHLAAQNFVATMVTGGVFERHPGLRFGAIELGAHWIGPLAASLDMWHENNQTFGLNGAQRLPRRPSEYIANNVRVSPFHFEPVDEYIERYGLADVYCYASDYPHVEGGRDPMVKFAKRLERFGSAMIEKFFVKNGEFLVPA
jgi:predicted TIM-barrel fold metal-dependent hydrolase